MNSLASTVRTPRPGLFSAGIRVRLLLAFGAVGVLAATANLIAEHGVAVIRTRHVETALIAPPLPPAMPVAAVIRAPAAEAARPPELDPVSMTAAIERYQRAVDTRVAMDSVTATTEIHEAVAALNDNLHDFQTTAVALRIRAYEDTGNRYIDIANVRRAIIDSSISCIDALDAQIAPTLEGGWKIFGRILARQSLLRLHQELEAMRRAVARLQAGAAAKALDDEAHADGTWSDSEAAFTATLTASATSLGRSQGDAWVQTLRDRLAQLVALRQSLERQDASLRDTSGEFRAAHHRVSVALSNAHLPARVPAKSIATARTDIPAPLPAMAPLGATLPVPAIDTVTTTLAPADDHARRNVAWITAAVLAVLLSVAISTVRSFAGPVERMLEATAKIAAGHVDVRIPSGGIRELDALATGFNRMAAQLAAARDMTRDYQSKLEERVEQRTSQLQHLAEHDPLTQLPNRRQLHVLLDHALQRAGQNQRHLMVFFMDIDNFKTLNDTMGHAFGDRVLVGIAQRLAASAQKFGFAGRWGGDEFTVVYEDAASLDVMLDAGRGLLRDFDQPLMIEGREVMVRASVGASAYPDHGTLAEDLLSAADAALFQAKALGRGQLAAFTPELRENASRRFSIEQGLRRAIDRDEFDLVFQPEVSLESMEVVLVESLLRWRLPDGRLAQPGEFLAITEESGLIVDVGRWVLRRAIATAAEWHRGAWPEARVAINVSPRQLMDPQFVDFVLALLAEYRLPPHCIELELTESVLQSGSATLDALRLLRAADIAIALDDFGTGYSSLASLENLPLTRIKLDRSLIAGIDQNPRSAAIAAALISLCRNLQLDITAEGIERAEQFAVLSEYRSIQLQGYLISKPVSHEQIVPLRKTMPARMHDLLLTHSPSRPEVPREPPDAARAASAARAERAAKAGVVG